MRTVRVLPCAHAGRAGIDVAASDIASSWSNVRLSIVLFAMTTLLIIDNQLEYGIVIQSFTSRSGGTHSWRLAMIASMPSNLDPPHASRR
jgi:hypothetical protein